MIEITTPSLPKLEMSCSQTHTTFLTARKTITANPHTSILYKESYKMSHPIFAAIILPLPTHAQKSNPATFSNTRYLCNNKPRIFAAEKNWIRFFNKCCIFVIKSGEGKEKKGIGMIAIVAVERKLLGLMFSLWKKEEMYNAAI